MEKLKYIDEIIDKLKELHKVECGKGIDYPCVTCLECPNANLHEYSLDKLNLFMKWTTNSAIISIKLPLRDYLDEFLHKELIKELSRRFSFILDTPQDNAHISLFIRDTDVRDEIKMRQIEAFLKKDVKELMGMITKGRILIKDWARYMVDKTAASKIGLEGEK